MTTQQPNDRPVPRDRTGPRPAPDEGRDPILTGPSQPDSSPAGGAVSESSGHPAREHASVRASTTARHVPTLQLSVRVRPEVFDLIDQAVADTGKTKRQIIEELVEQTYGGSN